MLKEDENFGSPIATVFYETYNSVENLREKLNKQKDHIQCIVADSFNSNEISFGQTQRPLLNDYADGVDTIEFLLKI